MTAEDDAVFWGAVERHVPAEDRERFTRGLRWDGDPIREGDLTDPARFPPPGVPEIREHFPQAFAPPAPVKTDGLDDLLAALIRKGWRRWRPNWGTATNPTRLRLAVELAVPLVAMVGLVWAVVTVAS